MLWSACGRPETAEILLTLIMINHWKQLGYKVYSTKEAAKGKKKKKKHGYLIWSLKLNLQAFKDLFGKHFWYDSFIYLQI